MADGLFDLCGSKRTDELFMGPGPPPPTPNFPVPSKPYGFCGRKAPWESGDDTERCPDEKPETSARHGEWCADENQKKALTGVLTH